MAPNGRHVQDALAPGYPGEAHAPTQDDVGPHGLVGNLAGGVSVSLLVREHGTSRQTLMRVRDAAAMSA